MSKKPKNAFENENAIDGDTAPSHTENNAAAFDKAAEDAPADVPESAPELEESVSPNAGGCYRFEDGKRVKV